MRTTHEVTVGDARSLDLPEDSVELVVTSPPYPMIELWDEAFAALDPAVGEALEAGEGWAAFEAMHAVLDAVWTELARVLVPGGIACVNVGDATRSLGGRFRCYPNAARVTAAFRDRGFDPLPPVRWHKPTNRATKFMGSGMLPPNAYVTLEHEHVLVLRNGGPRSFPAGAKRRYESAYFWEERNRWFSDRWEVGGEPQDLAEGTRERSGAFPVEIPYRLINMYSVYGDTVLDPFLGTGTTTLAAMLAARHSVGYERDPDLAGALEGRLEGLPERSRERARGRLGRHREFARSADLDYEATNYDVGVRTKQERDILLYVVAAVECDGGRHEAVHEPL
ncbi:MAG: site-specific DNA-methyltransferase [Halobacteriales archaeon]